MPKGLKIFSILIIVLAVFAYSLSPILRDVYKNWDDSNQREWREKWLREEQARQEAATKRYAEPKSLSASMPGSKGRIDVTISYKAVGFNQVAFRLNIEPVDDAQFTNFTKDRSRGDTLLYLNLRDADGFRVDEIGFTYPIRLQNKDGVCVAMGFEETHQVEFSVLDKVHAVDISSRASYDR
jgi:hypothetical protein